VLTTKPKYGVSHSLLSFMTMLSSVAGEA